MLCVFAQLQITENTLVCSEHFVNGDYMTASFTKCQRLKPTAKPSVFQWTTDKKKRKPPTDRSAFSSVAAKKLKLVSG